MLEEGRLCNRKACGRECGEASPGRAADGEACGGARPGEEGAWGWGNVEAGGRDQGGPWGKARQRRGGAGRGGRG